ncbi:uncharacterized protein LOC119072610 [Bradysia coprophila]|uniref:uncharacterized protein LOC119072610 n=1 Tax=Bradysia coprophila TaxID=38358 RepID=UPI00187DCEF3|nr:uncharacterized protein LOC119072610 [Bradysia coprophila]
MKKSFYFLAGLCAFIGILHTCFTKEAYQTKAVNLHNQYRRKHHAPALRMDNELNSLAVKCADYYARKEAIDFSCPYKGDVGENLASVDGGNCNSNQLAVRASKGWYSGVKFFNDNYARHYHEILSFIQMVWKDTQKCGFGYARTIIVFLLVCTVQRETMLMELKKMFLSLR